jgi:hypothetical protein
MFNSDYVAKERYLELIENMLKLRGAASVKKHIKKITGMIE